jgi:hypothetical protein
MNRYCRVTPTALGNDRAAAFAFNQQGDSAAYGCYRRPALRSDSAVVHAVMTLEVCRRHRRTARHVGQVQPILSIWLYGHRRKPLILLRTVANSATARCYRAVPQAKRQPTGAPRGRGLAKRRFQIFNLYGLTSGLAGAGRGYKVAINLGVIPLMICRNGAY